MAEEHNGPIDLVITDVIMPGMNGRQIAQQIMCSQPQARVLYVSGYTGEAISHHHEMLRGAAFLSKPFSSATLLHRCRELLDAPCRH
jgi:DNA-binding NarL/FixJ family response regulator